MSIVLFANVHDGPGPIVSDHTVESDHVIHGAYGLTDVDAAGPVHVTFTWAQAAPYELAVAFTNPRTGHHIAWSVARELDRKSTRLNSSHSSISYAVFCLKKKKT